MTNFFHFFVVPTTITHGPKDLTVTQGKSGIFHCRARGHPPPHIAWASGPNGDRPIPTEDRFRILPTGSLVIGRVNFTDQGIYRCVASNPAGSATAGATLTVTGIYHYFFSSDTSYAIFTALNEGHKKLTYPSIHI